SSSTFTVVKVAGATGTILWRHQIRGPGRGDGECDAIAVDRTGNVVAAGRIFNRTSPGNFTVMRIDHATGREIWRQVLSGTPPIQRGQARAVAIGRHGDVIAAGGISPAARGKGFPVRKL